MRYRFCCFLMLTALMLWTRQLGADEKAAEEFDVDRLVGSWQYVMAQKDGEKLDQDRLTDQVVEITKESFTLKGEQTFVMKYELADEKSPVGVKFTMTESPFGAGATAAGILELKNDELKLCYAPMGGETPSKFEANQGSGHHFFVLKRMEQKLTPEKLVGVYSYVSGQKDGEKLDKDHFAGQVVEITKDAFTLKGDSTFVMRYELDSEKNPASIKFTISKGPFGEGETAAGILQLVDGNLSLCYAPMGGESPTKFEAKEGSGHFLFVLQPSAK